ncbi:MAG: hypothetical protein Q8941_24610 [Bacteroidota bacterium]|nr:hypothetical protein [Bacteroidota bacterium]
MARQKTGIIGGRIANVIFYEFRGIQCSRSRPRKFRQTRGTIASANKFGIASRLGAVLRRGLTDLLPDPKDKKMMYRFNTVLGQWLRTSNPDKNTATTSIPFVDQFQFNPGSELNTRIKQGLSIDWTTAGMIVVNIPELDPAKDISAPAGTETVHWKIMAVRSVIGQRPSLTAAYKTEMDMPYNEGTQAAKQIELPFELKPNEITIVAIALTYTATKKGELQVITENRWLPAGIVGACCGKL